MRTEQLVCSASLAVVVLAACVDATDAGFRHTESKHCFPRGNQQVH
jgi:hypothetical protein